MLEIVCYARVVTALGERKARLPALTASPQARAGGSEALINPSLLQDRIRGVPGLVSPSTTKRRCVIGLNQISWSPLPCRSKRQSRESRSLLSCGVKDEPIRRPSGLFPGGGWSARRRWHPADRWGAVHSPPEARGSWF